MNFFSIHFISISSGPSLVAIMDPKRLDAPERVVIRIVETGLCIPGALPDEDHCHPPRDGSLQHLVQVHSLNPDDLCLSISTALVIISTIWSGRFWCHPNGGFQEEGIYHLHSGQRVHLWCSFILTLIGLLSGNYWKSFIRGCLILPLILMRA